MTLYKKGTPPIRDFPKIPPTLFKISLEKLSFGYNQVLIFGLKTLFFRFCKRYPIDENEKSKRVFIETARLKEVFKSVSLHFRINHIIVFFLGLLGVVFIRHGFA